ncbi:MAG: EmrA/EmrK family multidrug efflux transporter periplasmic adaptor subunit [Lonepinella koalarum]|nr:EmrA/EmrK family multidrug efflux transporter periplasmic adaptor subunit [Lonepinella koalarum]
MSEQAQPNQKISRRKALGIFALILLWVIIGSLLYWFLFVKGIEKTDDAYVGGNQVMVSSQVNGNIQKIYVDNMDFVKAGDVLMVLDDTDLTLAFEQAKSGLATTVRQLSQLGFTIKQLEATVKMKTAVLEKAKGDLARREQLNRSGAIDQESYFHAKNAVVIANAELDAVKNQLAANQALLLELPLKAQPEMQKAMSNFKQAWLNLQRSIITSPIDGYVARRSAQVGQKVSAGSPLLAVISPNQMWIDANFKETQLKNMRIGQPVTLKVDLYGDEVEFNGKVDGIDMGTGSAFSLLPAQNATGNWIKVVQRVPVRISLDPQQIQQYPLRIGLSSVVKVDVSNSNGEVLKPAEHKPALYATMALEYDQSAVENEIDLIIQQNSR